MTGRVAAKRVLHYGALSRMARAPQRHVAVRASVAAGHLDCRSTLSHQHRTYFSKDQSKSVYEYGAHRSDAEARIDEVPVVMVDGQVALCDGGGGALGHPLDYIQLASPDGQPVACKYCGIRYQMKQH